MSGHPDATHLRRSQRLYAERRNTLIDNLERHLGDVLTPSRPAGGVQLAARFRTGISDVEAARRLLQAGVETRALSDLCLG